MTVRICAALEDMGSCSEKTRARLSHTHSLSVGTSRYVSVDLHFDASRQPTGQLRIIHIHSQCIVNPDLHLPLASRLSEAKLAKRRSWLIVQYKLGLSEKNRL